MNIDIHHARPRPPRITRETLTSSDGMRLIEVHNGLSALVADTAVDRESQVAFDGVWLSSLTGTASYGLPDLEMALIDGRFAAIEQVTRATRKPVVVDGGTGGDVSSLRFLCVSLARFGIDAVVLEDKAYPKRNSLVGADQELLSTQDFCEKLWTAKDAVPSGELMVIARLESLISGAGMQDALDRAAAYAEANADGLLVHSRKSQPDEIIEFAQRVRPIIGDLPLVCVPTTYHAAKARQLFEAGFQMVIYANHQLRAAHAAMERACLSILREDASSAIETEISSTKTIFALTGYTSEMDRLEARAKSLAGAEAS